MKGRREGRERKEREMNIGTATHTSSGKPRPVFCPSAHLGSSNLTLSPLSSLPRGTTLAIRHFPLFGISVAYGQKREACPVRDGVPKWIIKCVLFLPVGGNADLEMRSERSEQAPTGREEGGTPGQLS